MNGKTLAMAFAFVFATFKMLHKVVAPDALRARSTCLLRGTVVVLPMSFENVVACKAFMANQTLVLLTFFAVRRSHMSVQGELPREPLTAMAT